MFLLCFDQFAIIHVFTLHWEAHLCFRVEFSLIYMRLITLIEGYIKIYPNEIYQTKTELQISNLFWGSFKLHFKPQNQRIFHSHRFRLFTFKSFIMFIFDSLSSRELLLNKALSNSDLTNLKMNATIVY